MISIHYLPFMNDWWRRLRRITSTTSIGLPFVALAAIFPGIVSADPAKPPSEAKLVPDLVVHSQLFEEKEDFPEKLIGALKELRTHQEIGRIILLHPTRQAPPRLNHELSTLWPESRTENNRKNVARSSNDIESRLRSALGDIDVVYPAVSGPYTIPILSKSKYAWLVPWGELKPGANTIFMGEILKRVRKRHEKRNSGTREDANVNVARVRENPSTAIRRALALEPWQEATVDFHTESARYVRRKPIVSALPKTIEGKTEKDSTPDPPETAPKIPSRPAWQTKLVPLEFDEGKAGEIERFVVFHPSWSKEDQIVKAFPKAKEHPRLVRAALEKFGVGSDASKELWSKRVYEIPQAIRIRLRNYIEQGNLPEDIQSYFPELTPTDIEYFRRTDPGPPEKIIEQFVMEHSPIRNPGKVIGTMQAKPELMTVIGRVREPTAAAKKALAKFGLDKDIPTGHLRRRLSSLKFSPEEQGEILQLHGKGTNDEQIAKYLSESRKTKTLPSVTSVDIWAAWKIAQENSTSKPVTVVNERPKVKPNETSFDRVRPTAALPETDRLGLAEVLLVPSGATPEWDTHARRQMAVKILGRDPTPEVEWPAIEKSHKTKGKRKKHRILTNEGGFPPEIAWELIKEYVAGDRPKTQKDLDSKRRIEEKAQLSALEKDLHDLSIEFTTERDARRAYDQIVSLARTHKRKLREIPAPELSERIALLDRDYTEKVRRIGRAYIDENWERLRELNLEAQETLSKLIDARLSRARQLLERGNLPAAQKTLAGAASAARNLVVEAFLERGREGSDDLRKDLTQFRRRARGELGVPGRVLRESVSGKTQLRMGRYRKVKTKLPSGEIVDEPVLVRVRADYRALEKAIGSQEHTLESEVQDLTTVREWKGMIAYTRKAIVEPARESGHLSTKDVRDAKRALLPVFDWARGWRWDRDRRTTAKKLEPLFGEKGLLRSTATRENLSAALKLLTEAQQTLTRRQTKILIDYERVKSRLRDKLYTRRSEEVTAETRIQSLEAEAKEALTQGNVFETLVVLNELQLELKETPHRPVPERIQKAEQAIESAFESKTTAEKLRMAVALAAAQTAASEADDTVRRFSGSLSRLAEILEVTELQKEKEEIGRMVERWSTPEESSYGRWIQAATYAATWLERVGRESVVSLFVPAGVRAPLAEALQEVRTNLAALRGSQGPLGRRDRQLRTLFSSDVPESADAVHQEMERFESNIQANPERVLSRLAFLRDLPRTTKRAFTPAAEKSSNPHLTSVAVSTEALPESEVVDARSNEFLEWKAEIARFPGVPVEVRVVDPTKEPWFKDVVLSDGAVRPVLASTRVEQIGPGKSYKVVVRVTPRPPRSTLHHETGRVAQAQEMLTKFPGGQVSKLFESMNEAVGSSEPRLAQLIDFEMDKKAIETRATLVTKSPAEGVRQVLDQVKSGKSFLSDNIHLMLHGKTPPATLAARVAPAKFDPRRSLETTRAPSASSPLVSGAIHYGIPKITSDLLWKGTDIVLDGRLKELGHFQTWSELSQKMPEYLPDVGQEYLELHLAGTAADASLLGAHNALRSLVPSLEPLGSLGIHGNIYGRTAGMFLVLSAIEAAHGGQPFKDLKTVSGSVGQIMAFQESLTFLAKFSKLSPAVRQMALSGRLPLLTLAEEVGAVSLSHPAALAVGVGVFVLLEGSHRFIEYYFLTKPTKEALLTEAAEAVERFQEVLFTNETLSSASPGKDVEVA
ncbi:MAG TPA: hypothetical protein VI895_12930, partial [Bdellovibrionota bacterium]|nr:hypothetical protein [Bdellovibrionota bacterium]